MCGGRLHCPRTWGILLPCVCCEDGMVYGWSVEEKVISVCSLAVCCLWVCLICCDCMCFFQEYHACVGVCEAGLVSIKVVWCGVMGVVCACGVIYGRLCNVCVFCVCAGQFLRDGDVCVCW